MRPARFLALLLLANPAAWAQDPVQWSLQTEAPGPFKAGEQFAVKLTANIDPAWHIYSTTQGPGGPFPTAITIPANQPVRLNGAIGGPPPLREMDANFGIPTETLTGAVAFRVPLIVTAEAPGPLTLQLKVIYQACDATNCLPPRTEKLTVPVQLAAGGKVPGAQPAPGESLGSFVWLAMGMGALSLLTPCVFPMVPITVSYFTNHAAARRALAVRDAAIYAVGIILTFTALGVALAVVFGAAGINRFAASPWINLLVTGIFLAFALSLFGKFEIAVPTGMLNRLDSAARSRESSPAAALLLMGLVFSLTSFTCTAPFVGTLLVMAAQGTWLDPVIGMLAFSSVFALPFFVLALAPQLLSQLPKSGGWLNSVKVVMGLLEIAAAMKFLSNVDLIWRWGIFTRPTVLAVWIALGMLIVIYLLRARLSVLRVGLALVFLGITASMVPGLFGSRLGELESFLPPAPEDPRWILNDLEAARQRARREQKRVFIDFTGYTCTNCRWMEANMFPRAEVRGELDKFILVRLYTDGAGLRYEQQQSLQQAMFHTVALPLYAILAPDGGTLATFPGLTRDPKTFLAFLQTR
jgi:thiol:disulfide interchange protein